jgi:hypothetical protein
MEDISAVRSRNQSFWKDLRGEMLMDRKHAPEYPPCPTEVGAA